ncbi:MAG: NAD(P)/FAD-dependent oxidoreductase [Syntrophaceae bacterium]|nr:NAD(P)/FAD-dependent oxidoreductase [Deltaproteobacteria bacterium]
MTGPGHPDAVVVGSGPNGLAAAVTLARAGRSVKVLEARQSPGGAVCSAELTLPGFTHDVCSAVYPLALDTEFFRSVPLSAHGLSWVFPEASFAHPLDDGSAVVVYSDWARTVEAFGADGKGYARLTGPFMGRWGDLTGDLLSPLRLPRHPVLLAALGLRTLLPVTLLGRAIFDTPRGQAMLAGLGAHSILPLTHPLSSAFALMMAVSCHSPGWPVPRGGARSVSSALVSYLETLGAEVVTSHEVRDLIDIEPCGAVFFDLSPAQVLKITGDRLPHSYRRRLARFRYGPGAFKVDWALSGPIPWKAPECLQTATIHVGGTMGEIARAEREVWMGRHPGRPFVFCVQPSLFDPARAPEGKHTAWAYCHVPNGSTCDMTGRIEQQIERFAPGFRDLVIGRNAMPPAVIELFDANCIGGDIAGGANTIGQMLGRPVCSMNPYAMPAPGMYLCSASTPPGGGVHGMCGYHAARMHLKGS